MKKTESSLQRQRNLNYTVWSKLAVMQSSLLKTWPAPVRQSCGLTLLALGALLSGCSQLPTQQYLTPKPPTQPVLTEPLPSVSYSTSAQQNIESWQKKLIDTSATSKP